MSISKHKNGTFRRWIIHFLQMNVTIVVDNFLLNIMMLLPNMSYQLAVEGKMISVIWSSLVGHAIAENETKQTENTTNISYLKEKHQSLFLGNFYQNSPVHNMFISMWIACGRVVSNMTLGGSYLIRGVVSNTAL